MNANGTDAKSTKAATDIKSAAQTAEVNGASGQPLTVSPAPGAKLVHAPWKAKQDAAAGENRESHSELSEDSVADSRSIVLALAGTAASDASNDSAAGASEHAAMVMADAEGAGGATADTSSSLPPAQPAAAGGVSTGTALLLGIPLLALAGGGGGGGGNAPVGAAPSSAPAATAAVITPSLSALPADTLPVSTTPASAAPTDTPSVSTAPADTRPASTTPADAPSVSTTPADTPPASTAPAGTAPVSTTPADTPPASTAPANTAPVSTAPADTPPVSTTPADTPPVSTAPALRVLTVAEAQSALLADPAATFNLSDTTANLAAFPGLLSVAASVTASDAATMAEATTIHSAAPTALYSITDASDTLASALGSASPELAAVQAATTISVTDPTLALTVNAEQFGNLLAGTTLLAANDTIAIDGADGSANLGALQPFGGDLITGMTLGGALSGSYIVDLGTSGVSAITMEGFGEHQITAALNVQESFVVGITSLGGSTINNLEVGDLIDVSVASITELTTQVTTGSLVDMGGEWAFDGGVLTWWDSLNATADILTLQFAAGATTLQLAADNHSFEII